jgi:hypothetical protein
MAVYGQVIGNSFRAMKEVGLRELIERWVTSRVISPPQPPLKSLAINPDEIVNLTSSLEGWGSQNRARRLGRLRSYTVDWSKKLALEIEDLQASQRLGLLDSLASPYGANAFADGAACILPHNGGGGFNGAGFFRASPAWLWDAVASFVRRIPTQAMGVEVDGLPLERASTNLIVRSAFDSGLTGWTTAGVALNGSDIAPDTSVLGFDPADGIPSGIKLLAGNPHAANLTLSQTIASVAANSNLAIQVDHYEESGVALRWFVRRVLDGLYHNGVTWAAGPIFNALSIRTALQQRPEILPTIATGAGASTFEIGVAFPSGVTAGAIARVFHIQCEKQRWASSRMVSFAASSTREEVDYCYANELGRRSFPNTRGTLIMKLNPNFSTAKADGSDFYFFSVLHDAANEVSMRYDGINAPKNRIVAISRAATVDSTAAAEYNLVEGLPLFVVFRYASTTDAELDGLYGAAAGGSRHFDIWAGTPGNVSRLANAQGAPPTEASESRFQIGGKRGDCAEARAALVMLFPYVLSDEEVRRWCS